MAHAVYEKPGCHAVATFEQAVADAKRAGYPVAIMECSNATPYDTGWHRVALWAIPHYEAQGYTLRAVLELTLHSIP